MSNKRFETVLEKIKEACASVMPIALIILLLSFTFCPLPNDIFIAFVVGTCLLTVGLGLFSLGAELSMERIGGHIGANLTRSRKIPIIAILSLIVGVLITISEPDLHVLAGYTGDQKFSFILAVAAGLGLFLVIAVFRIIFNIKFKHILVVGYGAILLLSLISYFVNPTFLAIAYDAGGVTTGAMSVPFVMSIGAGIASITSQNSEDDTSFGLMAVCSIGPILSILIMGLAGGFENISYTPRVLPEFLNSREMGWSFISAIPHIVKDVLMGLLPILAFFLIYQFFTVKVQKKEMAQIFIGAAYTFVGMVLFLVGVNVGFMPVGSYLGEVFAGMGDFAWVVIPVGMLIGFCMTYAEPAVGVLNKQVEDATSGTIPPKVLPLAMALGVALSAGIAMLRALTGIPILPFLFVGYVAAVALAFYCPSLFTSIAFDAGGVASGVMAATFLLPLSIGVCAIRNATADQIMVDAFGTIALVAMAPPITIQIVGLMYKIKLSHSKTAVADDTDILIIEGLGEDSTAVKPDSEEISLDNTAILDLLDSDDIEIIEFTTEYDNQSDNTPSGNGIQE
ncbi:MAG: DUF1538 domain-containing protein [Clostridia bacterium]|nr:DUF1538 domain-containing protein [Clostridia bacterium]